jgi:hypothetical protein
MMQDNYDHGINLGDVHLVLSVDEAGWVLESLVHSLQSAGWGGEAQENLTALTLFLRDYLRHPIEVPAISAHSGRTAA